MDARPRLTGFVAVPSATAQEDSVSEMMSTENTSEPREHVQRMTDGWKEDAKGVLIFVSFVQPTLAFYRTDIFFFLFQRPAFSPQSSLRLSSKATKCYPQMLGTNSRFNLHTLPPQLSLLT
jgi:hypothetical protein